MEHCEQISDMEASHIVAETSGVQLKFGASNGIIEHIL